MNVVLIGAIAVSLLLLISVMLSIIRGVTKARARFFCILISAALAFGVTVLAKDNLDFLYQCYEPQIQAFFAENNLGNVWEFIGNAENIRATILSLFGALLAPIVFVVLFIALRIVTWILYFIVTLFMSKRIRAREERRHFRPLRAMIYGLAKSAIVVFVFITPVFAYMQFAPALVKVASSAIPEQAQGTVNEENVEKASQSPVMTVYAKAGGSEVSKELTKVKIQGETTYLADEIGAIISLMDHFSKLQNAGNFENWGIEQAEAIQSLAGSFGDSKIITSLIGDVLKESTDKWLAGEAFMGTAKPSVGEYLDPAFTLLLQDLNRDSQSLTAISEDFKTIGDLIYILVRDGALQKMKDSDGMATLLANGSTIKDMVDTLNANENLKNIIPEMTKFGMKAVGSMIKLPEVDTSDYEQFFDEVTDKLNEVMEDIDFEDKASVQTAIDELTPKIQEELDQANVNVTLSDELIDIYSDIIIQEFKDKDGPITVEDLKELFGITSSGDITIPEAENTEG